MCGHAGAPGTTLPPGPRLPRWLQTAGFLLQPARWIEANRRRYGDMVTFSTLFDPGFVMVFDPELVKQVFRAPPDQLRAGEANAVLEPVVGRALGAAARRRRAPAPAQADAAAVPRRADARVRGR